MSKLNRLFVALLLLATALLPSVRVYAQDNETPPAKIQNDEGGPIILGGEMNYTNPNLSRAAAQPLIVLEDQAGFVDRNRGFLMPLESQVLGVITGDFFNPPFTYTLSLPIEPQGSLRDVDHDGEKDPGVMTYAVAYWTNAFGDPYLERRDLSGGGWSEAYASTRVKTNPSGGGEVTGGKYVVWAPDDQQGFPSGFGPDGKLFTEDDPIVRIPQGYAIVDMDTDPFTFDRSQRPNIELIEPEDSALDDYSALSYTEAFDAMLKLFRNEYAFTELKAIDWDAKAAEFRPRFEQAEKDSDALAYGRALRDFMQSIPDGHLPAPLIQEDFQAMTQAGLGMAIRDVDDGRTIVNFVTTDGPADKAGIELGAEIIAIDGQPIDEYISSVKPYSAPFSTDHVRRLQQLRYGTRAPLGAEVEVTFQNPKSTETSTATLTAEKETESFRFSSFNVGRTGAELPVEFTLLDNGLGYVKINSFIDNELLTVQLWEQMVKSLNGLSVPGLIIDMRQNAGGFPFITDQMAAYFFNDELELGNTATYDKELGKFYADPNRIDRFYPPAENLRYGGPIAVLAGPNCNSACEFFTYDMTEQNRADIVTSYPTAGLGGAQRNFAMPEGIMLQLSVGRPVDMDGNIIIEGVGVPPTVRVPVTEETLFYDGDSMLDTAAALLSGQKLPFGATRTEAGIEIPAAEETAAESSVTETVTSTVEVAATETVTITASPTMTPTVTLTATSTATATVAPTVAPTAEPGGKEEGQTGATTPTIEVTVTGNVTTTEVITSIEEMTATEEMTVTEETSKSEAPDATVAGETITIQADKNDGVVIVYAGPSGRTSIIGIVPNGSTWTVLESSQDGQWVRIDYRGPDQGGWINIKFVKSL